MRHSDSQSVDGRTASRPGSTHQSEEAYERACWEEVSQRSGREKGQAELACPGSRHPVVMEIIRPGTARGSVQSGL